MPLYEFRCPSCEGEVALRRSFAAMDDPAQCDCGGSMERQFTPTRNVHIPISFKSFLQDGSNAAGGGQLSWSDFHDKTERELARDPNVVSYQEAMSKPGAGVTKKDAIDRGALESSFVEAKERLAASS